MWRAAADARMWAAIIREHAASAARVRGWDAKVESDNATKRAAEAGQRIVDAQGRTDSGAMRRNAKELWSASASMKAAAAEFALASGLGEAAGAEMGRAARAYERAGEPEYGRATRGRAERALKHAAIAAKRSGGASRGALALAEGARRVDAVADRWDAGELELAGEPAALAAIQAEMWEDAKQERTRSTAMAGRAKEAERMAAGMRRMAAEAAERTAPAAAACEDAGPGMREAAAAWRRAMKAANGAAADADGDPPAAAADAADRTEQRRRPAAGGMGGGRAAARTVWRAAADARMWAASMRLQAMSRAHRRGWAAKAESEDAMGRAARDASRAADPRGAQGAGEALERALGAIRHAAAAMGRAEDAFRRSSRSSLAAASEQKRAAAAYGRAAEGTYRRLASGLAARSRRQARETDRLADSMGIGAGTFERQADRWSPAMASWKADGCRPGRGDPVRIEPALAALLEDAGRECARSMDAARDAADDEKSTAEIRRDMAAEAERSAAAAARVRGAPGAEKAAAAWRSAMAAADRAAEAEAEGR